MNAAAELAALRSAVGRLVLWGDRQLNTDHDPRHVAEHLVDELERLTHPEPADHVLVDHL